MTDTSNIRVQRTPVIDGDRVYQRQDLVIENAPDDLIEAVTRLFIESGRIIDHSTEAGPGGDRFREILRDYLDED